MFIFMCFFLEVVSSSVSKLQTIIFIVGCLPCHGTNLHCLPCHGITNLHCLAC